jgi:hypothetical protein
MVFLFLAIGAVVVAIVVVLKAQSVREANRVYCRLAQTYGGSCIQAGAFGRPSVRFQYKGVAVLVDVYSTGGKNPTFYTQLHVNWPGAAIRLEVYPERFFSRIGKLFGMEDIEIGDPQFDEQYIVKSNDLAAVRPWLSAGVRTCIEQLRHFLGNDDIYVSIGGGVLLVKKRSYVRQYRLLEQFARMSLDLFDQALLINAEGIQFFENPAGPAWERAICQICGEGINEPPVCCYSCNTPHHRECWEYYGACSTYGCGQTRYRAPPGRQVSEKTKSL